MIKTIDNKLRYSVIINNRDIVAGICINELNDLINRVEFVQDRQILNSLVSQLERQIGINTGIDLSPILFSFSNCKKCNCCNTKCNLLRY